MAGWISIYITGCWPVTLAAPAAKPVAASPVSAAVTPALPPPEPPRLVVSTPRGPRPSYRVGETMVVSVQPTQDAYVYCFYQDATGTVARIFPNRFQPDPLPARRRADRDSAGRDKILRVAFRQSREARRSHVLVPIAKLG